jgi:hypothetical protein
MNSLKDFTLVRLWSGHKDSFTWAHLAQFSKYEPLFLKIEKIV